MSVCDQRWAFDTINDCACQASAARSHIIWQIKDTRERK